MEIEALEAILIDEFKEIHPSESEPNTWNRCFQITPSPLDDEDDSTATPVQLGLIFSHTKKYSDEPPLLNVTRYLYHMEDQSLLIHFWHGERFEAELALERAKLMPEIALAASKEKKLTGRQWFESDRATVQKGAATITEDSDKDDEDIDFDDDDDLEDDEEDMLEHYLAEKSDSSTHSLRRAN